jgi:DNA-binding HxlR family transcriptional regulator
MYSHYNQYSMKSEPPCTNVANGCQIGELFQLLSKAHMLDILYIFNHAEEPVRFKDIEARLEISPNTLSARLKTLAEGGFITRTAYNEIPPRVDYEATEKAHSLKQVFKALHQWAENNTLVISA